MKSTDKIIVNGQAYNLGAGSSVTPEIPEVPDAPTLSDMVHDNGTEPATGNKWYITPDGAGSMDGSSWANAASASMIRVILLSAASGDSIYFAEGDYTADRTLTLPSGVSLSAVLQHQILHGKPVTLSRTRHDGPLRIPARGLPQLLMFPGSL